MEQSYFQIQLDRAIKEAERLVKTLYAVKTDYADKRTEEALPNRSQQPEYLSQLR